MTLDQLTILKLHLHAKHLTEDGDTVDLDSSSQPENYLYGPLGEPLTAEETMEQTKEIQAFLTELLSRHWPFVVDMYGKDVRELFNPFLEFVHEVSPQHLGLKGEWRTVTWNFGSAGIGGSIAVYEREDDMFAVLDTLKARSESMKPTAA